MPGPSFTAFTRQLKNVELLAAYFRRWHDRFDLFDHAHPFYQQPGFRTKQPSSINRLAQEMARGNNAVLFDHTTDDPAPALSPAQAARVLIAEQAFALGGGKSDTGNTTHAPLVSAAVILARGHTLFQTLCLNLTPFTDEDPVASHEDDAPVWERKPAPELHQLPPTPDGYLDYLTCQSRTLRLDPEDVDGRTAVRRVFYAQGRRFLPPAGFYDPMMAYQRDRKKGDRPLRFSEFRELWRDSAALFQFAESDQFQGPKCLHTLQSLPDEVLPRGARYRLSALGLCTDKAKVNFWRHDWLPLPLAYLDDSVLVASLIRALALADDVATKALRAAVWAAAATLLTPNEEQQPDPDRVRRALEALAPDRAYWSRLERPFREFMMCLPGDGPHQEACIRDWFWKSLRPCALDAYDKTVGQYDSARDLKGINHGRGVLFARLRSVRSKAHVLPNEKGESK